MVLDIILGVILLIMAIRGIGRGIVREALSFAGLTCALFLGAFFYPKAVIYLQGMGLGNQGWVTFLAFILIVLAVCLIFWLLEATLFRFLRRVNLSFIDYLLGLVIGLIEGGVLLMLILACLEAFPLPNFIPIKSWMAESQIANFLMPYVDQAYRGWDGWLESRGLA